MKIYILIFEREFTKSYTGFHSDLTEHPDVINWWHYVKSVYLIKTSVAVNELSEMVITLLRRYSLNVRHLVIEVNLDNRQGMLPDEAWKWIQEQ